MSVRERFWTTIAIWTGYTVTSVALLIIQAIAEPRLFSEPALFALLVILVLGATAATWAVWRWFHAAAREGERAFQSSAQKTHDRRVERLADTLDAEVLAELEADTVIRRRDPSKDP